MLCYAAGLQDSLSAGTEFTGRDGEQVKGRSVKSIRQVMHGHDWRSGQFCLAISPLDLRRWKKKAAETENKT